MSVCVNSEKKSLNDFEGDPVTAVVIGVLFVAACIVLAAIVVGYFYRKVDVKSDPSKSQFDYDTRSLDQMSVKSEQPHYNVQQQDSERKMKEQIGLPSVNSQIASQNGESAEFHKPNNEAIYENDNFDFDEYARPSLKINY